jgi:hypothetical protein
MKNYISTADLAIWIVLILARLVLCLSIWRKRLYRKMPWFSLYSIASAVESILLLDIAFSASYALYYSVFYVTSHSLSVLAFLTLIECGRRVLPGLNLPQKEKAGALLLAAIGVIVAFTSLWPVRFIENRTELGAQLSVAVAFLFIAAYSRYLRLFCSRLVAGISVTLGSLYLVQAAAKAMMAHFPFSLAVQVRQLSQIANVLAVIAWIVVVQSPWGTRELSEGDVQKIEDAFARVEASVGAGGVKTV